MSAPDDGRLDATPPFDVLLARAGLTTVAEVLARATPVRELPARSNHRLEVGDLTVFVKCNRHRGWRRRRVSPEALGLERLALAKVRVPVLLFAGVDRRLGTVVGTKDLAPARPLDDVLADGSLGHAARRAVLFDLARQVARLHEAGLHHRDLYLNHVFVNPALALPRVVLIDCERVGVHRAPFSRWVVKDLAALDASSAGCGVTRTERLRFLLAYLAARGQPVDTWLEPLGARIAAKSARIRRHVPRTPVGEAARP